MNWLPADATSLVGRLLSISSCGPSSRDRRVATMLGEKLPGGAMEARRYVCFDGVGLLRLR